MFLRSSSFSSDLENMMLLVKQCLFGTFRGVSDRFQLFPKEGVPNSKEPKERTDGPLFHFKSSDEIIDHFGIAPWAEISRRFLSPLDQN